MFDENIHKEFYITGVFLGDFSTIFCKFVGLISGYSTCYNMLYLYIFLTNIIEILYI